MVSQAPPAVTPECRVSIKQRESNLRFPGKSLSITERPPQKNTSKKFSLYLTTSVLICGQGYAGQRRQRVTQLLLEWAPKAVLCRLSSQAGEAHKGGSKGS